MSPFNLGDVVRYYIALANGDAVTGFGVVVQLPRPGYPLYRVRVSTQSFTNYVELGVRAEEMLKDPRQ